MLGIEILLMEVRDTGAVASQGDSLAPKECRGCHAQVMTTVGSGVLGSSRPWWPMCPLSRPKAAAAGKYVSPYEARDLHEIVHACYW